MMNIWLIIMTDRVGQIIGKEFLGLNTDLGAAKELAHNTAIERLVEGHVAEIDGIWCIEGRVADSDQMSFIGVYPLVKGN